MVAYTLAAPVQGVEAARVGQAAISPLPARGAVPVGGVRVPTGGRGVGGEGPGPIGRTRR